MISKKKLYLLQTIPFFVLLVLISISTSSYAVYQTNLLPGEYIQVGSLDLDVGSEAVPVVYDWDGDGKKDLLIGHGGAPLVYVRFYKNQGTDDNPSFSGFTLVQACNNSCALSVTGYNN